MATILAPNPVIAPPTASLGGITTSAHQGQRHNTSLYVGDLHLDVTETMLYEKFSPIGMLASIRVCRDAMSRRSLGYAYVNYQSPLDAEKAYETLNFESINGKPIRIMWSQRDPAQRRSGEGNVFIKNLDARIDAKSLYDTFSLFGMVLSCKVATDDTGKSRGYGFIQYDSEEAAQKAITKVDGMLLDSKKVFACKFMPRSARFNGNESGSHFLNVYVKNFGALWDKERLEQEFAKFGTITSCAVDADIDGNLKGFGFVAFEKAEDAEAAVNAMNGAEVEPGSGQKLTVCRAQSKSERLRELKKKHDTIMQKYSLGNLYVKQLDDSVDEAKLQAMFEKFGKISNVKLMRDENGRSKGFGFVCFESAEEANNAQKEMHGQFFDYKPIYVSHAQRKEDRKALLSSQFMQRMAKLRIQGSGQAMTANSVMPGNMYPQPNNYYMAPGVQNRPQSFFSTYANMMPQWNTMPTGNVSSMPVVPTGPIFNAGMRGGSRYGQSRPYQNRYGQPRNVYRPPHRQGLSRPYANPMPSTAAMIATNESTLIEPTKLEHASGGDTTAIAKSLSAQLLGIKEINEQKQLLGEYLYPLISKSCGAENAGKITGMILEMDVADLLGLIEVPEQLEGKTREAMQVLLKNS